MITIIDGVNGEPKTYTDAEFKAYCQRNFTHVKKQHHIPIKGYYSKMFFDAQTEKGFVDNKYGNGVIIFYGSDFEKDEYIGWLVDNEGKFGFKVI